MADNLEHDEMIDIHDNSANMVPQDGMHPQNNFIHVAAVQSDQQYSQPQAAADQQLQY